MVYDASHMAAPGIDYFSVDFWRSRQALTGEAIGRGSAWFIETPGGEAVLRHYLRGGWAAKLSRQAYFYTGVSRSRPFKEFHLLVELYKRGLPVPRPVAALCHHRGLLSSGAIMTERIAPAQTLADYLGTENMAEGTFSNIGRCIRRFHRAGVWHADLNARNILLDAESRVFLIDFDRARFSPGNAINGEDNLKRLKRSLLKLWPSESVFAVRSAWSEIEAAYDE